MSRCLYIITTLLLVTINCLADATITIGSANAMRGQSVTVAVQQQGNISTSAWQADLTLPQGITVEHLSTNDASTDRHDCYAIQSNGKTRLLSYSTNANSISNNNDIALLTLHISSQCEPGTHVIPITNIVMATAEEQTIYPTPTESFTISVASPLLGDVNNDGEVDVIDAIALNGYYLNNNISSLDPTVCDVNKDGDIDVADVIAIISIYLSGQ